MPRPSPEPLPACTAVLDPSDPRWPEGLDRLAEPPATLHVVGRPPPWPRAVAVVGTRRADDDALDFARELGARLAGAGCTVVSGGARGVDAAAHEGALEAGGPTVAVLASGIRWPYPPEHGPLFRRIAAHGALVAELEDCAPLRGRFLARNRLIAGLAQAVVVVQAPHRSGALSTAAHARRLERPVLAVPAAPWDVRGQGNLALLASGAAICTRSRDVLSVAAFGAGGCPAGDPAPESENMSSMPDLAPDALAVWRELGSREKHLDQLVRATRLPVARVQRALVELVLEGLALEGAAAHYRRPPPDPGPRAPN
ncbi:MAG: DNA-processing protein DprA [Myxococcota bacterium]